MRLSIFSNVQEPFVFPYFPVGMLTFFLLVSIPYIFFTYQKFTLSSIKCYHLERMEDKCPPLGEVPEPARYRWDLFWNHFVDGGLQGLL